MGPTQPKEMTVEACVMATDKPNHSRTRCAAEGDVFERDRKSSVVGRDMNSECKLFRGDCLDVLKSIESGSVDMVLADLPYGEVNRESSGLRNLNKGLADICEIDLIKFVAEIVRVCKGSIYLFCGVDQISKLSISMKAQKLSTRLGLWEKSNPSPMNGKHVWLSGAEFCVFGRKAKATFNEHCKKPIWKFPAGRNSFHPTQKPIPLLETLIKASTNEGDTVLDPTMGSGSTGVACKNLGRKFIGIEMDANYFAIAKRRIDSCNLQAELK